jgi:hypothetical protein
MAAKPLVLEHERARLAKEQADQTAMRNATARGELVPASSVDRTMISVFSRIRCNAPRPCRTRPRPRLVGNKGTLPQVQALLTDYSL